MSDRKIPDSLRINISESESSEVILAKYLRSLKSSIGFNMLNAARGYYHLIALAEHGDPSPEEIKKAAHECVSLLRNQICTILDYHFREHGIVFAPDDFATVLINPDRSVSPTYRSAASELSDSIVFDRITPSPVPVGMPIDSPPIQPVAPPLPTTAVPVVASSVEDDDDDDNLSDEEFAVKAMARTKMNTVVFKAHK